MRKIENFLLLIVGLYIIIRYTTVAPFLTCSRVFYRKQCLVGFTGKS